MRRNRGGFGINFRGLSTIGWLITMPIVLLILAIGFYEGRKAYWDAEVRTMCEKDGGIKVFETVKLDRQEYVLLLDKFGQLLPPKQNYTSSKVTIIHTDTSSFIRRSSPEVRRDELAIIRRSDNKVLGVSVSYSRVGGDLIALHPTYFSCPKQSQNIFTNVIQLREGKK